VDLRVAAGHVDEETCAPLPEMRRQPGEIHFRDALHGFAGVTEFDRDSYPVDGYVRRPEHGAQVRPVLVELIRADRSGLERGTCFPAVAAPRSRG